METRKRMYYTSIGLVFFLAFFLIIIAVRDYRQDERIGFSKRSGFYEEAFYLSIYGGAGNAIYYTLDGSLPTPEDQLYQQPIYLSDATESPNIYSARTDTSTGFLTELVDTYSRENPYYTEPDYNVDKCNIIRASVFDEVGNCLDTKEAVYFIGFGEKSGYEDMKIVSIVTEPDNLFGYETGIYVTGRTFDEYRESEIGKVDSWIASTWWWWTSNYSHGGRDSEREATVTLFDENRKSLLAEKCGIRIQGGGSRGMLPKSIGCYARTQYGNSNEFSLDIFGNETTPHKFVLFSGADDSLFNLEDYMVNKMEESLAFATMDFIPCVLFLNGEYWGTYHITESYNADYIKDHYGVEKSDVVMIKSEELVEGDEVDAALYYDMREWIVSADMSDADNYEKACELIDMESYIDYYAAQIYIARQNDWPGRNEAMWRTRNDKGTRYADGRWRWMVFDVNTEALSLDLVEVDTLKKVIKKDEMFASLFYNEEFKRNFAKRILYIGTEIYSEEKCNAFLYDYYEQMKEPICAGNRRFYNKTMEEEFDINLLNMKHFFEKRLSTVERSLCENIGEEWLIENGISQ